MSASVSKSNKAADKDSRKLARASVNGAQYSYLVPDGIYLFDMYRAIYLNPAGLKLQLDDKTFVKSKVFTQQGHGENQYTWVYFDICDPKKKSHTNGSLKVTFEGHAKAFKPRFPVIADAESFEYTINMRYCNKGNAVKHAYSIMFEILDDLVVKAVSFKCSYLVTENDVKIFKVPDGWVTYKGVPLAEAPAARQEVAVSSVHKKRADRPAEVIAEVPYSPPAERKSPPKKSRSYSPEYDEPSVGQAMVLERLTFEQQALKYALKHLVNQEDIKEKAIARAAEMARPLLEAKLRKELEKQVYDDIKAETKLSLKNDNAKNREFWQQVHREAVAEIKAAEEDELRSEALNKIYDEEKAKRRARAQRDVQEILEMDGRTKNLPIDPEKPDDEGTKAAMQAAINSYFTNQ